MTKLTRIEEVKKILKRICAPHFEYWFNDNARQICQLFPQPLDDKELEKEIDRILGEEPPDGACTKEATGCPDLYIPTCKECAKLQILALLQPKIEEAKEQEIPPEVFEAIEDAKILGAKGERERIYYAGLEKCEHGKTLRSCNRCWQALIKGGE